MQFPLVLVWYILAIIGINLAVPLKVANGTVEEPHSSPWQAKLYPASDFLDIWPCGGTLIFRNYIVTAARCFTFQKTTSATQLSIYLGVWDIQNDNEASKVYIYMSDLSNVIIHQNYNATSHENDIALIKLPYSVNITDQIKPAKLATERNVKIGDVAHINGWQYPIREWDLYHQCPHGGNVTVVENSVCQETYPSYVIDRDTICASGNVAFCYGDEGIALPVNGEVVGMAYGAKDVLTPSEDCPILPQTYLSIGIYLDWILANSDYRDN